MVQKMRICGTYVDLVVAVVPVHDGLVGVDLALQRHILLVVAVDVLLQVPHELEVRVGR